MTKHDSLRVTSSSRHGRRIVTAWRGRPRPARRALPAQALRDGVLQSPGGQLAHV